MPQADQFLSFITEAEESRRQEGGGDVNGEQEGTGDNDNSITEGDKELENGGKTELGPNRGMKATKAGDKGEDERMGSNNGVDNGMQEVPVRRMRAHQASHPRH